MYLKGKVALVTGSSKGLGKAIAISLAEAGATVVVNYHSNKKASEKVVAEISSNGGEAFSIPADITEEREVEGLVADVERALGSVDILVNNATGPQPELSLEEVTWQDYLDQLNFTAKAPLLLTKAVMNGMKEKGWGRIVNIGSEVVDLGNPNFSNYVTAKSAVVGMTRSWANELGEYGITVNAVHPGFTPVERHGEVTREQAEGYLQGVPLKRLGQPHEIGKTVSFLCSEDASFITGQNINVNGGKTF